MPRKRNPKREQARRMWLDSGGKKKLIEIADELDVSPSQIRKWKSQDKWNDDLKGNVTKKKERSSMKGNQYAKGNPGNPHASPPKGNKNAVKHGLFAKWMPEDTRALVQEIYTSKPEDIIWNNIMIQYAAIIRSVKIMNVASEFDVTSDVTEVDLNPTIVNKKTGKPVQTKEVRQYQYAWDKQANYLQALSRAQTTLGNLIKQFVKIADETDERRKKLALMDQQLNILEAKAHILNDNGNDTEAKVSKLLDKIDETIEGDGNNAD